MKKISFILMALAMVMGMTQCKKENLDGNGTAVLEGDKVQITLTLSNGTASKYDVDPQTDGTAPVHFEDGDVIWVAYNGQNCGSLTCSIPTENGGHDQNGSTLGVFSGDITVPYEEGQELPLYFYFLGNQHPSFTVNPDNGHVTGYTVDLSDQHGGLPVISYGISEQNYPSKDHKYTVKYNWLKNQCALVKFECENIYDMSANPLDNNADAIYTTTKPITIYGMANQVTIDLANPAASADALWGTSSNWNHNLDASFTWGTKEGSNGAITLYKPTEDEAVVRYAIVAPANYNQPNGDLEVEFDAAHDSYGFFGTYKLVGEVANNAYYQDAKLDLVWHSGAFSIASGQQAVFSRGNLQYAARGNTEDGGVWRFAKHQYDWVGGMADETRQGNVVLNENEANTGYSQNENIGANNYGWIDLFGWGTGGNGKWPINTSRSDADYVDQHIVVLVPVMDNGGGFQEWGAHNIINSGTPSTSWWKTLSQSEFAYLINNRTDHASKLGFAQIVDGSLTINGLVMLPDYWNIDAIPTTTNVWKAAGTLAGNHDYQDNIFPSVEAWMQMEAAGAVFLPAAGRRYEGTNFDGGQGTAQNEGKYHTSTALGPNMAYGLAFGYISGDGTLGDDINPQADLIPNHGHSVRLVHKLSSGGSKFFPKKN